MTTSLPDPLTREEIILIGPQRSGKSTLGALLAKRIGIPQISIDEICSDYYLADGFDQEEADAARASGGMQGIFDYMRRFEALAVRRLLDNYRDCVFDLGAGHTVQDNPADFQIVQQALEPFRNVILLLPDPDLDKSVSVLKERTRDLGMSDEVDFDNLLTRHPSNFRLAKRVVYTLDHAPEQTCEQILNLVAQQMQDAV